MNLIKLNLGCGRNIKREENIEWINCDIESRFNPDMILDLEKPLPFESNSIDYIYTRQVFEHIRNFVELMQEIHRVLKIGTILEALVPLFPCRASIADPDHIRFFVPETFVQFTDPGMFDTFRGRGLFDIVSMNTAAYEVKEEPPEERGQFFTELKAELRKVNWVKNNGAWVAKGE